MCILKDRCKRSDTPPSPFLFLLFFSYLLMYYSFLLKILSFTSEMATVELYFMLHLSVCLLVLIDC